MGRRKKGKLSAEELAIITYRTQPKCPQCEGHHTCYVGGFGSRGYVACYDCNHEWGYVDGRGSSITKQKFLELAETEREMFAAGRGAGSSYGPGYDGGDEMAKKKKKGKKKEKKTSAKERPVTERVRDPRLPKAGTKITGKYHGKEYTATVLRDGIEYNGKTYGTVSKVGSIIMDGKTCNGYVFFRLIGKEAEKEANAPVTESTKKTVKRIKKVKA